jgi:hypothetical protein
MKKVYSHLSNHSIHFLKKRYQCFILLPIMIGLYFVSLAQTTYTWNQTGAASWIIASNWTPSRITPAANDILVFNNGALITTTNIPTETIGQLLIINNTTVNLQGAAIGITLTIAGLPGDDLVINAGSSLNINVATNVTNIFLATGATGGIYGNMTFSNAAHKLDAADANAIIFNSPAIFTQDIGCTSNVFTAAGTANAIVFASGTSFVQNAGANPFGLVQPNSKVIFQTGSLFKYQQTVFAAFTGRTYANFELNSALNQNATGAALLTIDDLTITSGILNLNLIGGINIKGNITVAPGQTLTFNPVSPNTLNFNGTTVQSITNNGGTLTFGPEENVTINNASGITINSDVTLNKMLTLTLGILTVPNPNVLTLSSAASVATPSNASFVNGLVRKIGNSNFTFPIGKTNCGPAGNVNGYAPLSISNFTNGLATDEFTAEYKRGSAYTLGAISNGFIDHISRCDYWTLTRDVAATSTVDITLSWDDAINNCITTAPYIDKLISLAVVHNNNTGSSTWDAYGVANVTSGTTTSGTVTWDIGSPQSSTFGAFAIGSLDIDNPLPITINYFTGIKQNNTHVLNWKLTCNSSSYADIEMERCTDGQNYKSIYSMHATALRCQQPFDYTDNLPAKGVNYYRLKMTDANGKVTYSSIVSLINAGKGIDVLNIAPNPIVDGAFNLQISAAEKTQMELVITDMQGRVLQKKAVNMIAGFNTIPMNVRNLAAGTYQLFGNSEGGRTRVLRFVIQ